MQTLSAPTYEGGTYDGWYGDTDWDSIEHTQRWILPTTYKRALPINKNDLERMLTDPRSRYAEHIVAAKNRKRDDVVIGAALGNANTGPYNNLATTALPAGQKLTVGDVTTAQKLTIDLLLQTWQKLHSAEAVEDDELYFVTDAQGISDLLGTTEVGSSDYNTVKALAAGELNSYMGFQFLRTERLPSIVNATAGDFDLRQNFAYAKSGLIEGVWSDLNIRVDERADKNYTWQIYATNTCGAVRTQETKVVEVQTTIPGTEA
jgi:hypothetical protein